MAGRREHSMTLIRSSIYCEIDARDDVPPVGRSYVSEPLSIQYHGSRVKLRPQQQQSSSSSSSSNSNSGLIEQQEHRLTCASLNPSMCGRGLRRGGGGGGEETRAGVGMPPVRRSGPPRARPLLFFLFLCAEPNLLLLLSVLLHLLFCTFISPERLERVSFLCSCCFCLSSTHRQIYPDV